MTERLLISLRALKLTQARLSRISGVSTATLNNALTGDYRISVDSAVLICQATGLTLDWIFRGIRVGLPDEFKEAIIREELAAKHRPGHPPNTPRSGRWRNPKLS